MKLKHLQEVRYAGDKRSLWLRDALLIAKTNMERASDEEDWDFWNDYKTWLNANTKMLSQIYDVLKADRDCDQNLEDANRILARFTLQNDDRKFSAELWASNSSHEEFPIFKEFIRMQDNKERINHSMMIGNTMFDLLGGLRDEH